MVTCLTRSCPQKNGRTGHQAPIVDPKVDLRAGVARCHRRPDAAADRIHAGSGVDQRVTAQPGVGFDLPAEQLGVEPLRSGGIRWGVTGCHPGQIKVS